MTDRELLQFAAKAAGVRGKYNGIACEFYLEEWELDPANQGRSWWNPLVDDGDAMRLAVKLGMCVDCVDGSMMVEFFVKDKIKHIGIEIYTDDPYAATRRAIVRAAAEIGKAML